MTRGRMFISGELRVLISHFENDLFGRSYASEEQLKRPKRNCIGLLWSERLSIPAVMTFFGQFNAVCYVIHGIFTLYILASHFLFLHAKKTQSIAFVR